MLQWINSTSREIQRDPFSGPGKPEPFKHQCVGFWSRRINDEYRLACTLLDGDLVIAQCRYHY